MVLRRLRDLACVLASVGLLGGAAQAQAPAVVQLPSFSTFGVDTSVSVPDRGTAFLGGGGGSSRGSTAFGPASRPGNRSFGRSLSSSRTSVRATIHDMGALDRQALSRAKTAAANSEEGALMARRLEAARQSSAGQVPAVSVAEARGRRAAEVAAAQAGALQTLKRAREAAAVGKNSAAAVFYRMAAKEAGGELKAQIDEEAAALARESRGPQVAHSSRAAAATAQAGKTSRQ